MDIRQITSDYAVSPQIDPADVPALAEAGFVAIICNRPDHEICPDQSSATMRAAAEAVGLRFVDNPVENGAMTEAMVVNQAEAIAASDGPVFAYCRSGTRSTVVWALGQAGKTPVDDILAAAARAGYALDGLRPQLEAIASRN